MSDPDDYKHVCPDCLNTGEHCDCGVSEMPADYVPIECDVCQGTGEADDYSECENCKGECYV